MTSPMEIPPLGHLARKGASERVTPIGVISTPYDEKAACPRWPWTQSAISSVTLYEPFAAAAKGLCPGMRVYLLWWADQANRGVVTRRPAQGQQMLGVFASRGPDRPNPIGLTLAQIVSVDLSQLQVRGADCVDGTPLLDIKPAFEADARLWQ
jgi:tRNA-Thr(GGU) m(6)t(6)A37 methyltransferase TsaA